MICIISFVKSLQFHSLGANVKKLITFHEKKWLLRLEFKLQDMWIGLYWQNKSKRLDVWLCLLPCFPLHYANKVDLTEKIIDI